ncbi:hypothetical protein I79_006801 [Cricetulus griseus]|uniref:Uncharacterized protein n=1 Tax=Cricetulus griseus TaxID=10029 RepID=G3H8U0_CRIGR|nr:hypothetical protein I79_006801 [Cricetulus griseus]
MCIHNCVYLAEGYKIETEQTDHSCSHWNFRWVSNQGQLSPPRTQHHNQRQQTGQRETELQIQLSLATPGGLISQVTALCHFVSLVTAKAQDKIPSGSSLFCQ